MKAAKVLFRCLMVVVVLVLAIMVMRSIMRPEKFRNVYNERCELIKEKLITIRDVQAVYKNETKKFFADADSLADFALNGKVSIIKNKISTIYSMCSIAMDRNSTFKLVPSPAKHTKFRFI